MRQFASAYELKKSLKRIGYDLEGLQVVQNGEGLRIQVMLDVALTLDMQHTLNLLSEELRNTNVEIGLTNPSSPVSIGA
jgi:ribosome maturation factor RimP